MRRWFFYILIGFSAFGLGALIAGNFFRQNESVSPNAQEIFETRTFGDFRADLRRNTTETPIVEQPSIKKKSIFACKDKILSAVLNDLRKRKDFIEDLKFYLDKGESWSCEDILYVTQSVDLNGDGVNEKVVRGKNTLLCGGTGNCPTWIYKKSSGVYKRLLESGGVSLEVRRKLTNGYRNIFVKDHASCCTSYQTSYKFDRGNYKENQCLFVDECIKGKKIITTCAEENARIEEEVERQKNR